MFTEEDFRLLLHASERITEAERQANLARQELTHAKSELADILVILRGKGRIPHQTTLDNYLIEVDLDTVKVTRPYNPKAQQFTEQE